MSKSVLIIDTPKRCIDCDCFYPDDEDYWVCYPTWEEKDKYLKEQTFNPFTDRMPECPLVSMEHFIEKTKEVLDETADAHTAYCHNCNSYREVSANSVNEYSDWFRDLNGDGTVYKWRYKKTYRTCKHCGKRILVYYGTEFKAND